MTPEMKKQIDALPRTAGVYLFYEKSLDARRYTLDPIYIGKAINIRDRVKNHFLQPTYKDHLYINKISKIDFINTNSEIEALVLEAQLIKKHLPKFNVVWKDDKNYFYVAFEQNAEKIPFVHITHQKFKLQDSSFKIQHIGPFIEGTPLKKTLKYLRRVFPFYTTSRHPKTLCTWCHLGLCPGPKLMKNPPSPEASAGLRKYKADLKKLSMILQGKRKDVLYALRREMEAASKANKFEEAGVVRDKLIALERILEHTHVIESQNSKFISQNWPATEKVLQEVLGLETPVSKIECYDISNIQGKNAVGSMVVFIDGAPAKSQYKKFSIRVANTSDTNLRMTSESTNKKRPYELVKDKPNDIAMLKQVLTRRLQHPEWGYPEVMLIDGGIAQLNVAIRAKEAINVTEATKAATGIKIISIAKGKQELLIEGKPKLSLKELPQEIYNLVKHLDDEAHRFAITYHKKLRKNSLLK